jgi:hypothetical protein
VAFLSFFNNLTINITIENWHCYVLDMLLEQILAQWWHPVAPKKAVNLLHRAMHAVSHRVGAFVQRCFVFLLPWQPLGEFRASSGAMVASSGFWCSPGHAALGNTSGIAPMRPHGHQNGL